MDHQTKFVSNGGGKMLIGLSTWLALDRISVDERLGRSPGSQRQNILLEAIYSHDIVGFVCRQPLQDRLKGLFVLDFLLA